MWLTRSRLSYLTSECPLQPACDGHFCLLAFHYFISGNIKSHPVTNLVWRNNYKMKFVSVLFFLTTHLVVAQTYPAVSTNNYIADLYDTKLGANARLYTGARFIDELSQKQTDGNYYYQQNDWTTGRVGIDGQMYDKITLRFNMITNQLIIQNNYTGESIVLQKEKIDFFELHNTRFVFLTKPESGYYAQLNNGSVKAYARYICITNERIVNNRLVLEIIQRKKYFIEKEGIMHSIKSRRSALKVLATYKSELKKKLREEGIRFNSQKEKALATMAEYFDQLQK